MNDIKFVNKIDDCNKKGQTFNTAEVLVEPHFYLLNNGSPTGSQYDMMPVPGNFGKNRLPTRTPIEGLFVPKFSHGIWPSIQAGLQVVDMITHGKIMSGNSSFKKKN
jgi:hypothetical protein